jgi:hypothetical protein
VLLLAVVALQVADVGLAFTHTVRSSASAQLCLLVALGLLVFAGRQATR